MARRLIVLALLPALSLFVWGFVIEPALLHDDGYEIGVPGWPTDCDQVRVAILADLHVGSPRNGTDKLDRIVERTQERAPDLILLAGDYVIHGVIGGTFTEPERIASALGRLTAPMGVWAVLGNHDWWLDGPRVRAALEAAGIRVLEDASARIDAGSCRFWLSGISDFREARHDVSAALAQVSDDAPVVAFTHNPDVFPDVPRRVSLTIAGHTHGGQVYIPLVGRPIVPSSFGERFAIGHIVEDGRHLFVSPGLGTSILPVRFLVPPEIPILSLRATAR
jgi:predicted MPP superfamily phosphohydrolase